MLTGFVGANPAPAQTQVQGQNFTVLYTFSGGPDGKSPVGGLLRDSGGNFYGTTQQAGNPVCDCGTIYELTPSGTFSIFHIFTGAPSDGAIPTGGLAYWQDYFYGATASGGASNAGTVYTVSDRNTGYAMLHSFSPTEGTSPQGRVTMDASTNIYGGAAYGGDLNCSNGIADAPAGCGTIFKVSHAGSLTVLHTFTGGADGATPYELDGLIRDSAGTLYGTTYAGGDPSCQPDDASLPQGCGTVFKLDSADNKTILYTFAGTPADGCTTCADGIGPIGGLIKQGSLYFGTTTRGGNSSCDSTGLGCGTFFELGATNTETILHSFTGSSNPEMLTNSFGVTVNGGTYGYGTVYKVNAAGVVSVLHNFTGGADGAFPQAGLVRDPAGNLFGTTSAGGNLSCSNTLPAGCGTIFEINISSGRAYEPVNQ